MSEPIEQHVAAFLVWAGDAEQDTSKTAEMTGIPRRTIQYWMKRDDWRGQWLSHGAAESEQAAQQGKQMMRYGTPMVARRLLAIVGGQKPLTNPITNEVILLNGEPIMVWGSSDKDAVQAAKVLALYALGTPLSQTDVSDPNVLTASYSLPSDGDRVAVIEGQESVADLRAAASAAIESTVQAVNTRTGGRGRKRV